MAGEIPRAPLYVNAPAKRWPVPDLFPNLAAFVAVEPGRPISYPPEPTLRRLSPQLDIVPNVALLQPSAVVIPALIEPTFSKRLALQPDLFPNIAVTSIAYIPSFIDQPLTRRILVPIDVFPNLAALAPAPVVQLNEPIDPWINKRYPPQLEIFQNRAVFAPAESTIALSALIEPKTTPTRLQIDSFPNLAAITPAAQPITPAGKHRKRYGVLDGQKLLIFDTRAQADTAKAAIAARNAPRRTPRKLKLRDMPHPREIVPLSRVAEAAAASDSSTQYRQILKGQDYTALARQFDHWRIAEEYRRKAALERAREEEETTLALRLHADIHREAQAEIDKHLGTIRSALTELQALKRRGRKPS